MPVDLWKGYLISSSTSHMSEKLIITDTEAMVREDEMKSGACTHAANIRFQSGPHMAYPFQKAAETLQKWKPFLYQWLHLTSESGDSITCGPTETIPSCGSPVMATHVVWAFAYVFSPLKFLQKAQPLKNSGQLGTSEKEAVDTSQSPQLLPLVTLHTCLCAHKAWSHEEDYVTSTASWPVFLN